MSDGTFHTTRWSVIQASHDSEPQRARRALGELAEIYWYPLWAFAKRSGLDTHAATDAVGDFFLGVIEHASLAGARPEAGRFRGYLRTAFRHFLINQAERSRALKRGGGAEVFAIDAADADRRYTNEPVDVASPEALFDQAWARALLDHVVTRLANEWEERGELERFTALRGLFLGGGGETHAEVALLLGMTEGSCKVAVHRLRKRYKTLLTEEIGETLTDPGEVEEELAYLFRALRGDT